MGTPYDYKVEISGEHGNDDPCACGSCDWRGPAQELDDIESCSLTPGDASPAGRCPECNSLAYLDRPKDRVRDAAPALLAALQSAEWTCEDPDDRNGRLFCPVCGGDKDDRPEDENYPDEGIILGGHADNCALKAALDAAVHS